MKPIKRRADDAWSHVIYSLWPYCAMCGRPTTDAHHINPRGCLATRYEIDNGIGLCRDCHDWVEQHEKEFRAWLDEHHPRLLEWFYGHKNETLRSVKAWWYAEQIERLEAALKGDVT